MTDSDPFPWLPLAAALEWLQIDPSNTDKAAVVEDVRLGACEWIEDQRPDLRDAEGVFQARYRTKVAARLAVARLVARMDSPFGFVAFQELGAASILSTDPDVRRLVGRPRPRVG
jgi:hypothetical protein